MRATDLADVSLLRIGATLVLTDRLPGGTKERALRRFAAEAYPEAELVYASPRQGLAQVAIARVAATLGKRAVIFTPQSSKPRLETELARQAGADVREVRAGYLTVLQARARQYAAAVGDARVLPFGLACEEMVAAIAGLARELLPEPPADAWCAAGSGTLARGLGRAWPSARIHAVAVGKEPDVAGAELFRAPEPFAAPAQEPPPFSSPLSYDAKVWRFCQGRGGVFWNVAEGL